LGTASSEFVNASLHQLIAAARLPNSGISEIAVNASLAFIEGAKPEGEVEGALVLGLRFSKAGVLRPSNAQDVLLLGHHLHGHQRYH
jgi:hypothetical protein